MYFLSLSGIGFGIRCKPKSVKGKKSKLCTLNSMHTLVLHWCHEHMHEKNLRQKEVKILEISYIFLSIKWKVRFFTRKIPTSRKNVFFWKIKSIIKEFILIVKKSWIQNSSIGSKNAKKVSKIGCVRSKKKCVH